MWALVCIAHLWIRFCVTFPLKARRGLQRQNCSRQNSAQCWSLLDFRKIKFSTPCSVSLPGVQLCAVLALLDLRIFQFLTPRSVSLCRVRLRTVLACAESDSAQDNTTQSLTPRRLTLHGVEFFANISTKTNF